MVLACIACANDIMLPSNSYREVLGLLQAVNHYTATVGICINASTTKHQLSSMVSRCRMLTNSSTSVLCLSQTARTPKRLEAGLILSVPHSLTCNPVFVIAVKYLCVKRAGSTSQWCDRFCSTVAKHSQYGWPTKECWWSLTMAATTRVLHVKRKDCVPTIEPLVWPREGLERDETSVHI